MSTCHESFKPTIQQILRTILKLDDGSMTGTSWCGLLQVTIEVIPAFCAFLVLFPTKVYQQLRWKAPTSIEMSKWMYICVYTCMSLLHAFNQPPMCNVYSWIWTTKIILTNFHGFCWNLPFRIFFTKNQPFNLNLSTSKRHSLGIWMCQHGRMHQTFVVDKFVQLRWLGGGSKIHQMQKVEMV